MSKVSHTPGPWSVCGGYTPHYTAINSALGGYIVFSMADSTEHEEHGRKIKAPDMETQRANAQLIAAAPDLLHAVQTLLTAVETSDGEQFPGHHKAYLDNVAKPRARAAIFKARGEEDEHSI